MPHSSASEIVKGKGSRLAHAHESKCCFSPVHAVTSTQAVLFHNIVKKEKQSEASRLLGCEIFLPNVCV